jgi:hypothetical protein
MPDETGSDLLSRRLVLLAGAGLAAAIGSYGFSPKEFWESKDPSEWNSDEIARMLSKSPWAKATSIEGGPNRTGNMGRPGRIPRQPRPAPRNNYHGSVVWESAAPVRAASGTKLPDGFEGQYVLGVSGLPLTRGSGRNAMDRIKQVTTLKCKGRQPIGPAAVQEDTSNGAVYLFGFAREALPLSKDDKDLVFTTHIGRLAYVAKFNPKEMLFRGEVAV